MFYKKVKTFIKKKRKEKQQQWNRKRRNEGR